MKTTTCLSLAMLMALGLVASEHATAGCAMQLEVVGASPTSKTIRTYSEGGKQEKDIDKVLALKQLVLDCNESLGLVKVELTNHEVVWINRSEAKRIAGAPRNAVVCVTDSGSRNTDHVVAGTNGAEPAPVDPSHCKPAGQ